MGEVGSTIPRTMPTAAKMTRTRATHFLLPPHSFDIACFMPDVNSCPLLSELAMRALWNSSVLCALSLAVPWAAVEFSCCSRRTFWSRSSCFQSCMLCSRSCSCNASIASSLPCTRLAVTGPVEVVLDGTVVVIRHQCFL